MKNPKTKHQDLMQNLTHQGPTIQRRVTHSHYHEPVEDDEISPRQIKEPTSPERKDTRKSGHFIQEHHFCTGNSPP